MKNAIKVLMGENYNNAIVRDNRKGLEKFLNNEKGDMRSPKPQFLGHIKLVLNEDEQREVMAINLNLTVSNK